MTSIAFILGVVPLVTADGAGAASQQALGTVVFGGVLASTQLAIPFVPVFFIVLRPWARLGVARAPAMPQPAEPGDPAALTLGRNARRLTSPGGRAAPAGSVVNWQDSVRAA